MAKKFPDGHFYSPVVNLKDVVQSQPRIWPDNPEVLGIDFNHQSHVRMLSEVFPQYMDEFEQYPLETDDPIQFHINNPIFSWLDSRALFIMLRYFKPKKMIEIGSGMSSLLVADVNCRFLNNQLDFTCVEPYPKEFLVRGVPGISRLLQEKVEDLPLSTFDRLERGDILFIDSSHVSKTGSDVNHIYFEIIPRLKPGVLIHVHDIFLPADYPKKWVIQQERSWNEQYILQALLMYTKGFEVIFGCSYAFMKCPQLLKPLLGGKLYGGGSIWLQKIIA